MRKKTCNPIVTQAKQPQQLCLWEPSIAKDEVTPFLQIKSVPIAERIDPRENRYILLIQPHGLRAAGVQLTSDEAYQVGQQTKRWDWSFNADGRLRCESRLEALLDRICKHSFQGGEA